jgi:hypothetical protein
MTNEVYNHTTGQESNRLRHPLVEGEIAAQYVYDTPEETVGRLGHDTPEEMGGRLGSLRNHILTYYYPSERRHYRAIRGIWRACLAPIVHGIEIERDQQIQSMLQAGEPLTIPEHADTTHLDGIFAQYGDYDGRNLAFLRASGWLSDHVAAQFLQQIADDKSHWCRPILDAYRELHPVYMSMGKENAYDPSQDVEQYIRDISVGTGVSVIRIVLPAGYHAPLWQRDAEDVKAALLRQTEQLTWPGQMTHAAFKRNFSYQERDDPAMQALDGHDEAGCPFAHRQYQENSRYSIWHVRPLRTSQLPLRFYCPGDIDMLSRWYPGYENRIVSANTLRITGDIHVAAETLFKAD